MIYDELQSMDICLKFDELSNQFKYGQIDHTTFNKKLKQLTKKLWLQRNTTS